MYHTSPSLADGAPADSGSWLFVHIPKCGGTSVLNAIRATLPDRGGLELNGDEFVEKSAILKRCAGVLSTARVVFGHRVFAGLREFMPQPVRMVTVLRNPVDRAISHYNFILTRPPERQRIHGALTSDGARVPFADWLAEFPPAGNHLVWMLFHVLGDSPHVFDFSLRAGTDHHRIVSARLHEFTHVHRMEAGGVAAAIRQITGRDQRTDNSNRHHAVDPRDPAAREAAAAACPLDLDVYEQASRVFCESHGLPEAGAIGREGPDHV